MDEGIQLVLSKLDTIIEKVDGLEERMDRLEERVSRLEEKVARLEERMDRLEEKVDRLETRIDSIETRMDSIETRMDELEEKVDDLGMTLKEELEKVILDRFFVFEQRYERAISLLVETLTDRKEKDTEQERRMNRLERNIDTFRIFTIRQEEKVANMETGMLKWYQDNPGIPKLF